MDLYIVFPNANEQEFFGVITKEISLGAFDWLPANVVYFVQINYHFTNTETYELMFPSISSEAVLWMELKNRRWLLYSPHLQPRFYHDADQ